APARLPLAHGKPTPDCAAHFCDTDLPAAPPRTPPPPPPIAPAETAPYPDCCARPAARAATATLLQTLAVPHRDRADRAGDFPSPCSSPDPMARAGAPRSTTPQPVADLSAPPRGRAAASAGPSVATWPMRPTRASHRWPRRGLETMWSRQE